MGLLRQGSEMKHLLMRMIVFVAGRHTPVPVSVESMCGAALSVVCGQNCTFVVNNSGAVLACGEGSYGRLSLGNSEDVYTPTLIAALQGKACWHR